ncbi:NLR family, CARD domain containing 5 [Trichomycterus rosablanca]|uniref:NLR family, CARD domain containing 5 n=1 Tax=Trichomycterus rosablanca TaxID=2290929 RepID=UPI002F35BB78
MKMDEVDLEEDVLVVVAQEASEIVDILCREKNNVLQQIYELVDARTRKRLQSLPTLRDSVSGLVDYFKTSDRNKCCQFLNTMWMFCEMIPLELEIKMLSTVGTSTGAVLHHSHLPDNENSHQSHYAKRPCLDQVQSYTNAVKSFLQKKFERLTKDMRRKIWLDKTWLCWKPQKSVRVRERTTKNKDREESLQENKEPVESLLKNTGRVIILSGQAGSGKTLLMHCLGHHWAQGAYNSIELLFLLEFRQLNLVTQPLSLKELLFRFFLPPNEDDEQSEAVLSFIQSNPEKICFIFDGYDEFGAKLTNPEKLVNSIDPDQQLPMVDLLSALCSCKILPKCTVLVTCRPRDVFDLFENSEYIVAELLGFNEQRVKEYTEEYFQEKESTFKERAVSLLMDSHHLLSMSYVPGLCHVCCVCLDHLLSNDMAMQPETQLPTSLTQIYLHILSAFLSRCQPCETSNTAIPLLQMYRVQIAQLSKLAMDGLEKSCIVFSAQELSPELINFAANAGILSRLDLICADGSRSLGCAFTHLTMQEFMAALHLMTSPNISESQLKGKLNLKSRWTAKTDPKTVFTDSLHLFLCGLAAKACTSHLTLLEVSMDLVRIRQNTVLKFLQSFVFSGRQTGPKIVELCRCAHETQDVSLAKAVGSRERFELRNIRLNPVDMDALAFVTSAANQRACLDFGACSIEEEVLNIIPNCKNLEHLIFRGRKYDDKFTEALSCILPKLQSLKQLDFISGALTDAGAAKLFQALKFCSQITHLDVSDNSLRDGSVGRITDLLSELTSITTVKLGKNNISKKGIFMLVERMAAISNFKKLHINGKQEMNVLLCSEAHTPNGGTVVSETAEDSKEIILEDYNLKLTNLNSLCSSLRDYTCLTVLKLSSNSLGNKGLKKLLELLPTLGLIQEINVSDNGVDMDGLVLLSSSVNNLQDLIEIDASHNGQKKLILKFKSDGRDSNSDGSDFQVHKKFSLTYSDVQPKDMNQLCKNLIQCPNQLEIDFSNGALKYESIEKLLSFLPDTKSLMLLNLSDIQMSTDCAVLLVQSLVDCHRATRVELRPQGKSFIKFLQVKAEAAACKLTQYNLSSANVAKICDILQHYPHLADLDLSSNVLGNEGVKIFADLLPSLQISSSVSLNDNNITEIGALYLVNLINTCERVAAVEVSLGEEKKTLVCFKQENVMSKSLCLRHCCFETIHFTKLTEILTSCPRQVTLELSSSTLPSESLYHLLTNLARLTSIQTIVLRNNTLNAETVKHLVKHLHSDHGTRSLKIEEPWIKAEAAVTLVTSCLDLNPHIKEIRVEKACLTLSVERLTSSSNVPLSAVHSIRFDDCEVEGQHLSSLQSTVQKCSSLQELHFLQLTMDTGGAEFLTEVLPSLQNLKTLSLSSKAETGDEAVLFSLQHTQRQLERLSLSHHVIRDSGAAALRNALQSLTHMRSLNLLQCSGWTAAGGHELVRGLVHCLSLEEIQLDSVVLDEGSTACLAQGFHCMTSLKKISLNKIVLMEGNGVVRLLAGLSKLSALEELELEEMRMGDCGIEELVKYIPNWTNLSKVNLSGNMVSDHAGESLMMALSNCKALQQLNLSRNNLSNGFAFRLGQVLPSLSQLSELNLSENSLGSDGCSSLSEVLVSMKALKKLHLTSVGTSDLAPVASSLKHCTSVEDISLSWNKCGNDVVLKLVEVLPHCNKLKRLDLEANNINTTGAKTLAECLKSCPWIQVIRLWRNPIKKDEEILKDQRLNFSST